MNGYYAVLMDNEDQSAPFASNAPFTPFNEIQHRHSNTNNTDIDIGHLHHNDEAEAGRHQNDDTRTDGRGGVMITV